MVRNMVVYIPDACIKHIKIAILLKGPYVEYLLIIYYFNSFHISRKKISLNQIGILNLPNQLLIMLPSAVSPSFKSIENINSKDCKDHKKTRLLGCNFWLNEAASPTNKWILKFNNRNTRRRCEICSKLTIKYRFVIFIVNFEHISHSFLVFLSLTLNMSVLALRWMSSGQITPRSQQ